MQPPLEVLKKRGVGTLVDTIQLVGVGLEVVEFLLSVAVLDILVGLSSYSLKGALAPSAPCLAFSFAFSLAFGFATIFIIGCCIVVGLLWRKLFKQDSRTP